MEAEEPELTGIVKWFLGPAMERRGGVDIAEDCVDIDGFAEVTANVFSKPLHLKNFPQKSGSAKKFLRWPV